MNKELEFVWRPMSRNLGISEEIFVHTLFDSYIYPEGLILDHDGMVSTIVKSNVHSFADALYKTIQD